MSPRVVLIVLCGVAVFGPSTRGSLVAFYTFNDGTATDASGNGNDGILSTPAPVFTGAGFQGGAFDFSAALNNLITVPVDINPGAMPQVTMGGWFNADFTDAIRGILSHDNGNFDRTLDIDFRGGGGDTYSAFTGSGVLAGATPAGDWTFVAMRHDQATGSLILTVGNSDFAFGGSASFGPGETDTTIGRNPNFDFPFDGRIDNVFIYDSFLSDGEFADLRARGEGVLASPIPEPGSLLTFLGCIAIGVRFRKMCLAEWEHDGALAGEA